MSTHIWLAVLFCCLPSITGQSNRARGNAARVNDGANIILTSKSWAWADEEGYEDEITDTEHGLESVENTSQQEESNTGELDKLIHRLNNLQANSNRNLNNDDLSGLLQHALRTLQSSNGSLNSHNATITIRRQVWQNNTDN